MAGGRPEKSLTEKQIKQIEELSAYLTQAQLADYLGIAERTFREVMARDENVSAAYKTGRAKAISKVAKTLLQKAWDGDNACMMFFLKTQAGWRETSHIDHTSSDGTMTPKAALDVSKLSKEAMAEILAAADASDNQD